MADRTWTAPRRLYLDKAGKVVEADDPARAVLLVAKGLTIPLEQARALGLLDAPAPEPAPPPAAPEPDAEPEAVEPPPEKVKRGRPANKLRAAPGEDKAE